MNANAGAIVRLSLQRICCAGALAVLLVASIAPLNAEGQEKDWNAVIAAAKKEGKVVVYGTSSFREILDKAKPIFEERYGIKVEALTGRPLAGRSRGTDVPLRIFLIPFFKPHRLCDP